MDISGAVHYPLDCHLNPATLMRALRERLAVDGMEFRFGTPVTGWARAGAVLEAAITPTGPVVADEFVLAGGVWSDALARDLGLRLPMQAGKGYSLTLPQPPQLPQLCSILVEARVAVTPIGRALRVGGTLELSGLDPTIRAERVQGIVAAVQRYFPGFSDRDFRDLPAWHGFRPCAPDGLPYLGRCAGFRNLTAATGHAMMGVSLAPVTGRIVAQLLTGEAPRFDLHLLRPDRFA